MRRALFDILLNSTNFKVELALIIEKKDFNPLVLEEFQNFKEIPKKAKNKEKLIFGGLSDLNDKMRKSYKTLYLRRTKRGLP